jgi:sulfoxide reductase heme-binding subunit YedZ
MTTFASVGPSAYWYLTRGTGTIALILLTLSVAFGVANIRRVRTPTMPRFVFDAVHRNVSLLAVAFVAVHILTSVLDSFAPINLIDAVIPFVGAYRPLWLGLGTVAFDLLLAVAITSMLRQRFGYRTWRLVHWAAYASWPVALLHGLGTGSDTKKAWMLAIVAGCVVVLVAAVVSRATSAWTEHTGARLGALGAAALLPLGLLVWLPGGPLAHDWARRAGTPPALLGVPRTQAAASSGGHSSGSGSGSGGSSVAPSAFSAQVSGNVSQSQLSNGLAAVHISLGVSGQSLSRLTIDLQGQPIGGGIQMTSSTVTLGTSANPTLYRGSVNQLEGTNIGAQVRDSSGHTLKLAVALQLNPSTNTAAGTVQATP